MNEARELKPNTEVASPVDALVSRLLCWWFGCVPDHGNAMPWYEEGDDYGCHTPCKRCENHDVSYGDMVGDTRHNRFKSWCNYWLFRKWWPIKCTECGHRFKCDESIDHIPF